MMTSLAYTHSPLKLKFYLLEYFYVLLKSVERYSHREDVFSSFKLLKKKYRLGESKYKRLTVELENLTKVQEDRYRYTFKAVIEEAIEYGLIEDFEDSLVLTSVGKKLLSEYTKKGIIKFNHSLFTLMEGKSGVFKDLIEFLYNTNAFKPGLLVFPIYSPRQLGFERSAIRTTGDFVRYSEDLVIRLQGDISNHLREQRNLKEKNLLLLSNLSKSGLLATSESEPFDYKKYNVITKRVRDYWINYFLKEIYNYKYSWSNFERWVYRAKQFGIIHATEFYPDLNGKIVYPTAVVVQTMASRDFEELYRYSNGDKLYIHSPKWEANQEKFVSSLVNSYFDLRRSNQSYFISLPSLRELVCYKLKISEYIFERFLENAYRLNLAGKLAVRISLEVDKLPEETKAMYLTKEPVLIDGNYRNIIAIDVAKGENL